MPFTEQQAAALNRLRMAMAQKERGKTQQLRDEDGNLTGHYVCQHVDLLPADVVAVADGVIAAGKATKKVRELRKGAAAAPQSRPCYLQADCAFHLLDLANAAAPIEEPAAEPIHTEDGTTVHDTEHATLPPLS